MRLATPLIATPTQLDQEIHNYNNASETIRTQKKTVMEDNFRVSPSHYVK